MSRENEELAIVVPGRTTAESDRLVRSLPRPGIYSTYIPAYNEPCDHNQDEVDLSVDPPPDLVIEVDISHSSLNKFPIYTALEVPEVWLCDGEHLRICVLQGQEYVESEQSAVLPQLPIDAVIYCLGQRRTLDENEIIREFRRRVRG